MYKTEGKFLRSTWIHKKNENVYVTKKTKIPELVAPHVVAAEEIILMQPQIVFCSKTCASYKTTF